jgi:lysophospholipase L1-like esterase
MTVSPRPAASLGSTAGVPSGERPTLRPASRTGPAADVSTTGTTSGVPGGSPATAHPSIRLSPDEAVRFAALGDSVTVGIGDPLPSGGWRGWAVLLTEAMAPAGGLELGNYARCGALIEDVAVDQLPRALAQRPSHASVLVGVNDTLRSEFELASIAARLEETVVALRGIGTVVLTASLPDPGQMLRVPTIVCRPLARRVQAINAVFEHLAMTYGTIHLDLARHPAVYDPRMWGVDRIHPSERGHRFLAGLFADSLAAHGMPLRSRPDPQPSNPPPSAWAQAYWMATKGTGWVCRRSLDLLPGLTRLVIAEIWHEIRDQTARLDDRLRSELAQILPPDARGLHPADLGDEIVRS